MKSLARITFTIFVAAASLEIHSRESAPTITDAWVKTTVPGGRVSAAYMSIKSAKPLKLVKVETPVAGIVELHNISMKDGVMEMKAVDAVDIPANRSVDLKPGGLHVMLMKVAQPINTGDNVPLVLTFESASKKSVVVKLDATAREKAASGHKH